MDRQTAAENLKRMIDSDPAMAKTILDIWVVGDMAMERTARELVVSQAQIIEGLATIIGRQSTYLNEIASKLDFDYSEVVGVIDTLLVEAQGSVHRAREWAAQSERMA